VVDALGDECLLADPQVRREELELLEGSLVLPGREGLAVRAARRQRAGEGLAGLSWGDYLVGLTFLPKVFKTPPEPNDSPEPVVDKPSEGAGPPGAFPLGEGALNRFR